MDFNFLGDHYERLSNQNSLNGLFAEMTRASEHLGLPHAVYGNFSPDDFFEGCDPVLAINYPGDWVEEYFSENLLFDDPVNRHILTAGKVTTWEGLAKSKADKLFFERAAGAGLAHGVSIPLLGPNGSKFALSFSSCDPVHSEQALKAKMLAELCHSLFIERMWPAMPDDLTINAQQKRILEMSAQGMAIHEIAVAMGLSDQGVKYHLGAIAKKLGTRNVTHSVAVAIKHKLIW